MPKAWSPPTISGRSVAAELRSPAAAGRSGYVLLIGLLVLILGMSVVAGIVAVDASSREQSERVRRAQEFLESFEITKKSIDHFHDQIGELPRTLSQLATPITAADQDICGQNYAGGEVNAWSNRYAYRVHPLSGTPVFIGVADDTLEYQARAGGGYVIFVIRDVDEADARRLDRRVDTDPANAGSAAGKVRWTAVASDGTVTARWYITTGAC